MRVKTLVAVALVVAAAVVFWLSRPQSRPARSGADPDDPSVPSAAAAHVDRGATPVSSGEPTAPKLDRPMADRMRRELRALLEPDGMTRLAGEPLPEPAARDAAAGGFPTMPMLHPGDGGEDKIDPKYIQGVVRNDYFPLARQCYGAALEHDPKLAGKIALQFTILGDRHIGGVVDDLSFTDETTIKDPAFQTCMRESMLSVTFDAPPEGGEVTIVYPIVFSPEDDE